MKHFKIQLQTLKDNHMLRENVAINEKYIVTNRF